MSNNYFKTLEAPNSDIYYPKHTVHTVIGTQTASTGSWTGNLDLPSLYDGLTIMYYLPYAGSGNATLNLTLSDGTTTGAINCYYSTGRLTTHYGAGNNFVMTYYSAGSIKVNGTATTDNRWIANAQYFAQDTSTIIPYYTHVTSGANGIKQYSLFARTKDGKYTSFTIHNGIGTKTFDTTTEYDLTKIFYYNNSSNLGADTVCGNNVVTMCRNLIDMRYSFNGVTDSASTSSLSGNKPVYIVATPTDNGYFKLVSPYYTQTPTSSDTNVYVLVGYEYDSYRMDLHMVNPIYRYDGTNFIPFRDAKTVNGHTVESDVPSDAVFTDTKNTAGSTDTSSKIYLIGATSQASNPQTYSDNEVYATSGVLTTKSVQIGGGSCTMQYNSSTKSCDFVFT